MKAALPKSYNRMSPTVQLAVNNFQNKSGLFVLNAKRLKGSMKDYIEFSIIYPVEQIRKDHNMIRLQKVYFAQEFHDITRVDVLLSDLNIKNI